MEHQVDGKDISSLRVVDLKVELEKRGLSKSGTKNQLAERLINYLDSHSEESGAQEVENDESSDSIQEVPAQYDNSEERESQEQAAMAERERLEQAAKAECERLEQEAKAEREQQEQAAKAELERQEQEAKAKLERQEQAAKVELERQEQKAKAEKERQEQEAKAVKERQDEVARAERERKEQEAKAEQERKEQEAKAEQEKQAKAERERIEQEAKAERERQEQERLYRERLQLEVEQEQDRKAVLEASEREEKEKMAKLRQEKARLEEEVRFKAETERREEQEKKYLAEQKKHEEEERVERQRREDEERQEKERAEATAEENDDDDAIVVNTTEIISDDDELSQEPKMSQEKPNKSLPVKRKSDSAKSSQEKKTLESEKLKKSVEDLETSYPKHGEEPIPFRRLLSRKSENSSHPKESKKGTWSSRAKDDSAASTCLVSSSQLKDIIPDIRPFLDDAEDKPEEVEKEARLEQGSVKGDVEKEEGEVVEKMEVIEEEEEVEAPHLEMPEKIEISVRVSENGNAHHKNGGDHVVAGDKLPKPIIEKKSVNKISEANTLNSSVISIRNLVRPFTEAQLRECLKRTGNIVDQGFWINKIKSHAIVQYSSPDEAEETVAALDGVKWPATNPKQLIVTFSDEATLHAAQEGAPITESRTHNEDQNNRNKRPAINEPSSRDRVDERDRDHQRDPKRKRLESDKLEEPVPQRKSLDELFRKTKAQPCIYWLPKEPLETKPVK